ncbi:cathepsin K-like [Betta splendens]|uniref:Cathepsin K-like n=1 Tax=Betta splendens TaxID=158456 RepID=A0A6P7L4X2_BETSP|nr:cathepsin K-like [Betta splendens]XP_040924312.1 cathepsin K-like [Betta splendens]
MLLVVCVMLLVASRMSFGKVGPSLDEQWEQWKTKYKKLYKDQNEEELRRRIWEQNKEMIEVHNKEAKQGNHSYKLGMNQFGDKESVEMPVMKASDKMLRHILPKISRKMTVLDQELRNQIWEKMNKKLIKYEKFLNQQLLNNMIAEIEDDDWVSAYDVLEKVKTNNLILRALVMNDIYEQMADQSIKSKVLILTDIAETVAQYQKIKVYKSSGKNLSKSIDYRRDGLVTPVRNQGACGSCWAFSAAGALEGQLAKKTGRLLELSPQNLVDCELESDGCDGGEPDFAFEYVQENGYVHYETDYPYIGEKQKCHRTPPPPGAAQCKGVVWIPEGDERLLAEALHEVGPLSVSIDASDKKFMFYKSGVYYNPVCNKDALNHAMLLVGYKEKHWIVKNSWGEDWGKKGYIKIARNHDNHCGIASDASYPLV